MYDASKDTILNKVDLNLHYLASMIYSIYVTLYLLQILHLLNPIIFIHAIASPFMRMRNILFDWKLRCCAYSGETFQIRRTRLEYYRNILSTDNCPKIEDKSVLFTKVVKQSSVDAIRGWTHVMIELNWLLEAGESSML